ncbi:MULTISPECIES: LysR family transcriptional regulator [Rhizobium]|uniref:LysR family transcriptional regulator n=1 Tax=Rhizobium TaxID=379 RepID=UPI002452F732|nr:LysR family transcriptional regulator [Rhizobium favelukesii]
MDLGALLQYRNISRAAQHVGRTQPAMSRALSTLRGMFNDDLLVRGSRGSNADG